MDKLVIFVHTCSNYEESRAKKIERTWGDRENVVFITDNAESSLKRYIYVGEYKKGCTYHPENVIKMFYLFMTYYSQHHWFMMIDDDSYLYIDHLIDYLQSQDHNDCLMIGDFLNWTRIWWRLPPERSKWEWVGGGPGIVFTKKCVEAFLFLIHNNNVMCCNHDVWLHKLYLLSDQKSIKRVHCDGFHQFELENVSEEKLKLLPKHSLISVHLNRNLNMLYKFHELFKNSS